MPLITQLSQLDPDKSYTYADYLTWRFEEFVELIKGKVLRKMAGPSARHQRTSRQLGYAIEGFVRKGPCEMFQAPFDVRLTRSTGNGDAQIKTVVQPDIFVVCDRSKIDERGCLGAPDWIVEIVSPGNVTHDIKAAFDNDDFLGLIVVALPQQQIAAARSAHLVGLVEVVHHGACHRQRLLPLAGAKVRALLFDARGLWQAVAAVTAALDLSCFAQQRFSIVSQLRIEQLHLLLKLVGGRSFEHQQLTLDAHDLLDEPLVFKQRQSRLFAQHLDVCFSFDVHAVVIGHGVRLSRTSA